MGHENNNEKGETPLHRAAIAGDGHLVGTLIDQGPQQYIGIPVLYVDALAVFYNKIALVNKENVTSLIK